MAAVRTSGRGRSWWGRMRVWCTKGAAGRKPWMASASTYRTPVRMPSSAPIMSSSSCRSPSADKQPSAHPGGGVAPLTQFAESHSAPRVHASRGGGWGWPRLVPKVDFLANTKTLVSAPRLRRCFRRQMLQNLRHPVSRSRRPSKYRSGRKPDHSFDIRPEISGQDNDAYDSLCTLTTSVTRGGAVGIPYCKPVGVSSLGP